MNTTTFTILLGGLLEPTDRLRAAVRGTRVIAADGGMRHAAAFGLRPELWVGDFDSSNDLSVEDFPDVPRMPYPAQKSATDGEIAIEAARERGATRFILAGALGGVRSDHAMMHMIVAMALAKRGLDLTLSSGVEEAYPLVGGTLDLDLPKGSLFSVIGMTDLEGLSIANARYPLTDFSLPFGSSRTISNVAEGNVTLSLGSGEAIVLARPYDMTGA